MTRTPRPSAARLVAERDFFAPTPEATELGADALEVADLFSRLPEHRRRNILAALRKSQIESEAITNKSKS
jgi:hypothetical protein